MVSRSTRLHHARTRSPPNRDYDSEKQTEDTKHMISNDPLQRRASAGFSLMEVLVAMLILAIGLLGLASLQTQSLKFNHDAYVRSQATILAADIMDKMRADPPNPGTNDPWFDVAVPNFDDCDLNLAPDAINDATPLMAVCVWQTNIQGLLPSGSGGIVANPLDGTMFDITIQWSRPSDR